jgi:glycosyltransferase involved in cell wall biosynthesis
MVGTSVRIGFVIPVRNAAAHLPRCIRSIRQSAAAEDVDIIVVDNGSTDDSAAVARSLGARVLTEPRGKVGALRNLGARATGADVLAFVDADHEIGVDWVSAVLRAVSDERVGAAGALCRTQSTATWVQQVYDALRGRLAERREIEWLGAGNMAVRRRLFEDVGGFDEGLEACEDVDLCRSIRERGFAILNEPAMDNIHYGDPSTLGALFMGELWRGRDNLRVSLRGGLTWRSLPGAVFPVLYLVFLASALVGLFLPAPAGRAIAMMALIGCLVLLLARWSVIVSRSSHLPWSVRIRALAVAGTYDLARAAAIVVGASHRARQAS